MARVYLCPCCGFATLTNPQPGSYEICPVCFWEDDPAQKSHPRFAGGANEVSLEQARRNYIDFGASQWHLHARVRPPAAAEFIEENELPGSGKERADRYQFLTKSGILAVVRAVLTGAIGMVEGSRHIAELVYRLDDLSIKDPLRGFISIAREVDGFPTGEERERWDPQELALKDQQLAEYEQRLREPVLKQCGGLEIMLRDHLLRELERPAGAPPVR